MTDILIPDWSEFQRVDHARAAAWLRQRNGGGAAAIFRVCYGDTHVDLQIDWNLDHADLYDAIGVYAYLPAGADPRSTAQVLARVVRAHGGLRRTWFVVCDDEEGAGDQSGRVDAFLGELDVQLLPTDPAGEDWWYSGLNFALLHHLQSARGHRIIAAYQATEPTAVPHDMWQRTDAQVIDGVSGPCDCSVFHGSIGDLLRLIGASLSIPGGGKMIAPHPTIVGRLDAVLLDPSRQGVPGSWAVLHAWSSDHGATWSIQDWTNPVGYLVPGTEACVWTPDGKIIISGLGSDGRWWLAGSDITGTAPGWENAVPVPIPGPFALPAPGPQGPAGPAGPSYDDAALKAELARHEADLQAIKATATGIQ